MGRVNRRIGKSSETAGPTADGTGGGVLDAFIYDYFNRSGNVPASPGASPGGMTATGGIISDYTDPSPGKIYRAHVFTGSGTFNVTALGNGFPNNVEYLVVAGGGGGGGDSSGTGRGCGGGGAGGFRTNVPGHPLAGSSFPVSTSPGSYTVTVGGGGIQDLAGSNSVFGSITSAGGGRGSRYPGSEAGGDGGSGGGGHGDTPNGGGAGNYPSTTPPQGNGGGSGANVGGGGGGGGGGAGGVGANASGTAGGNGGPGSPIAIETTTAKTYAGGGAGAGGSGSSATGGAGGGGNSGPPNSGSVTPGTANTGGGGGGASGPGGDGGAGGSGIVVVRYQIGSVDTRDAKASGGNISFYGGKTIHAFTGSGTFANPTALNGGASNPLTVEMIVIGGGGGGGYDRAGGGGAGSYVHATNMAIASGSSHAVVVGGGGIGGRAGITIPNSGQSGDSAGLQGTPSTYNSSTIIALGGGGGGATSGSPNAGAAGGSGGSGGGSSAHGPRAPGPAVAPPTSPSTAATTDPGGKSFQNAGGQGAPTSGYPFVAAGGGGAGGAGGDGSTSGGPPYPGVTGGVGKQLPSTFQDPASSLGYPGPSGNYWVAGGGGSGATDSGEGGPGGGHPTVEGSYAGGGIGGESPITFGAPKATLRNGRDNSGGGGGGGGNNPNGGVLADGAFGGSGLVLIAYPT